MNFAQKVPGMLADLPKLPTTVDNLNTHAFSGVMPVMLVVGVVLVLVVVWAMFLRRSDRDSAVPSAVLRGRPVFWPAAPTTQATKSSSLQSDPG